MLSRKKLSVWIGVILLSCVLLTGQDCAAQTGLCDPDPCQSISNAIAGTCSEIGGSCTGPSDFFCSCDGGYTWQAATHTCEEPQPSCIDNDGDGYGNPADASCTYPELDCDDSDPDLNPGAIEGPFGDDTCSDGLDNDCDGFIDANDSDCDDVVVTFPDPNLEDSIRGHIFKPTGDIMASDLQGLEVLYDPAKGITDLSGVEYCVDLVSLGFSISQISDLSPISRLVNLGVLVLFTNQISDLSPISGLVNLVTIELGDNQITDLQPLVSNAGVDSGDYVSVNTNPLDTTSCTVHIPALESRGVTVYHDCP